MDNVNVVRDLAGIHDGVKTADTSTATARKTPESIGTASEGEGADCQRQRGSLVVHHIGERCFYRLEVVGLIKLDKTDCKAGQLSGEGGWELRKPRTTRVVLLLRLRNVGESLDNE